MSSLYELTGKYLQLQALLEADEGDYPIEMLTIGEDLKTKVENYGRIIRNFESDIQTYKDEIDRLKEKKETAERAVDRLKKSVFESMKATKQSEIKTQLFQFSIRKNGGMKPLVITGDVPEQFCRVKYEPDKDRIREAIEEDGEVLDFAHIEERGEYLKIK